MSGQKTVRLRHDLAQVLKLGLAVDAGSGLLLFAAGFCLKGFSAAAALQVVRSGWFILGALVLLVVAGLVFLGSGKAARVRESSGWQARFMQFGFLPVAAGVSIFLLAAAVVLDYLLFYL